MLAFVCAFLVAAAPAPDPRAEARLLVEQGGRLETSGKDEVALELYRAALLLAPNDPEPHRRVAELHRKRDRCVEAIPEYRAYVGLVPAKAQRGPAWEAAVVGLATCVRAEQATLTVRVDQAASCTIDGGAPQATSPQKAATFTLTPGEHELACRAGETARSTKLTVAAREVRSLEVSLATSAALRVRSAVSTLCALDGGESIAVSALPIERALTLGPHRLSCACPGAPIWEDAFTLAAGDTRDVLVPCAAQLVDETDDRRADVSLLPVVGPDDAPLPPPPPETEPQADAAPLPPPVDEAPPVPADPSKPAELEIQSDGLGWACMVGDELASTNIAGEAWFELAPGTHEVECTRAGAEPVRERLDFVAGQRRLLALKYQPRAAAPVAPPAPTRPAGKLFGGPIEWGLAGGIAPALGSFGIGISGRYDRFGLLVGTGLYPLAVSASWFTSPGRTGVYFNAGWIRVGEGVIGGGSSVEGFGFFGGGGVEVRLETPFAVRMGAGLGINSAGTATGPLTFDLAVVWLP